MFRLSESFPAGVLNSQHTKVRAMLKVNNKSNEVRTEMKILNKNTFMIHLIRANICTIGMVNIEYI